MSHEPVNIYVRLTDDGRHIRKWAFKRFEGSAAYVQTGMPVTEPTVSEQRIRKLEQALIRCRDQFFFYAEQHLAKETKEGDEKGATNREFEEMCDAVLGADRCESPGCRNPTKNGICEACDRWVDQQVVIGEIVRDIAELSDRQSPADQPDMMLVTAEELQNILGNRLSALTTKPDGGVKN